MNHRLQQVVGDGAGLRRALNASGVSAGQGVPADDFGRLGREIRNGQKYGEDADAEERGWNGSVFHGQDEEVALQRYEKSPAEPGIVRKNNREGYFL